MNDLLGHCIMIRPPHCTFDTLFGGYKKIQPFAFWLMPRVCFTSCQVRQLAFGSSWAAVHLTPLDLEVMGLNPYGSLAFSSPFFHLQSRVLN